MAEAFIDYIQKFQVISYVGVEDFADKFNFLYSTVVFMLCISLITVKLYVMKPISCYLSTDTSGQNLLEYVENFCWVQGTIPFKYSGKMPQNENEWEELQKSKILYYQWVPFVLSLQCILFYLPRVLWQMFCYNRTGTDIQHLVTSANQAVHSSEEARQKMVLHLAKSLEQLLFQHRDNRKGKLATLQRRIYKSCNFLVVSKRLGNWLVFSYFVLKLAYLTNAIGQMFLMQHFLGFKSKYSFFGIEVANNILNGRDWQTTLVFPRVGFCFVKVEQVGGPYGVTAQCVLPVNMLNERLYMFLWYWVLVVAIVTAASIPTWFVRIMLQKSRRGFIRKYLKLGEEETLDRMIKYRSMIRKFETEFLRQDGFFLLQMICLNAGDIITAEIVCQLWRIFKLKYVNRSLSNDNGDESATSKMHKMADVVQRIFQKQKSVPAIPTYTSIHKNDDAEFQEKLNFRDQEDNHDEEEEEKPERKTVRIKDDDK